MTYGSRQGLNIAFVGLNITAQTACAEYLYKKYHFKRMDMDAELRRFLRQMYSLKGWAHVSVSQKRYFYDAIYKIDPTIFINHFIKRVNWAQKDLVVPDVRYLNELRALQEMDFKIVRVTSNKMPRISTYVKGADTGTTALSVLYDKNFASSYKVEYSINYTKTSALPELIDPMLEKMGYNLTLDE